MGLAFALCHYHYDHDIALCRAHIPWSERPLERILINHPILSLFTPWTIVPRYSVFHAIRCRLHHPLFYRSLCPRSLLCFHRQLCFMQHRTLTLLLSSLSCIHYSIPPVCILSKIGLHWTLNIFRVEAGQTWANLWPNEWRRSLVKLRSNCQVTSRTD